jgi:hypothetical protein
VAGRAAFCYGSVAVRFQRRAGIPVASVGRDAIAILGWGVGEAESGGGSIGGRFVASDGSVGLLVLAAAHQEPLVFPARADVAARLEETGRAWRDGEVSRRTLSSRR